MPAHRRPTATDIRRRVSRGGRHESFRLADALEARVLLAFDPTAEEQLMLEYLNRMRMNPQAELALLVSSLDPIASADPDIDDAVKFFEVDGALLQQQWSALTAVQPVGWAEGLYEAAEFHNLAMIEGDEQSHQLAGEPGLGQRATNASYVWSRLGENIYAFAEGVLHGHAGWAIDWGNGPGGIQSPAGHRDNMMNGLYREVGIRITAENDSGTSVGPFVMTQDFGDRQNRTKTILLGVVFDDDNGDEFYGIGEGQGGVTVTAQRTDAAGAPVVTTSMSEGGYQLELNPGTYTITFSGGELDGTLAFEGVVVGTQNVKLDAIEGVTPAIAVVFGDVEIADGDATPASEDGTDFGEVDVIGRKRVVTFAIVNTGTETLTLTGTPRVAVSGEHSGEFRITKRPGRATLEPGQSTTFRVRFNPGASGIRAATVSILSNDPDGVFDFGVQGTGVDTPEVEVFGRGVFIPDGDATPQVADGTDFGERLVANQVKTRVFRIDNLGLGELNITGTPRITISGEHAGDFVLRKSPRRRVESMGSTTFSIRFDPSDAGVRNAVITITSDDRSESIYSFSISGLGV